MAANEQESNNGKEEEEIPTPPISPKAECTETNSEAVEKKNSVDSPQGETQSEDTPSNDVVNHEDAGSSNQNEVVDQNEVAGENNTVVNSEEDQSEAKSSSNES